MAYVVPKSWQERQYISFVIQDAFLPIPITVPYSGWASSALTTGGQKARRHTRPKKKKDKAGRKIGKGGDVGEGLRRTNDLSLKDTSNFILWEFSVII